MQTHGADIHRFCVSMLGDRSLADDAHQSTFVRAYETLGSYSGQGSLRAWLFGIARHRCLDAAKISRRWRFRFHLSADAGERDADTRPAAEQALESQGRTAALATCLRELAPHIRLAVLLRYEEGLGYEEIARMSRERAPAVQARVARALPVLRECVSRHATEAA
jgi:RNA polymerase sigma factor (sigma-70 family)